MNREMTDAMRNMIKRTELISLYRRAYEMVESSDYEKPSWEKHKASKNIDNMQYGLIKSELVDMLLMNDIKFEDLVEKYKEKANPANGEKIQDEVVWEVKSETENEAFKEAMDGNWNTINDRYLSDSQRDAIMIREEIMHDERYDDEPNEGIEY